MKTCQLCGTEYEENFDNQQLCEKCYKRFTGHSRPKGLITSLDRKESEIRIDWNRHATEKNEHIVGAGYAERQIRDTLSKVEKIKTDL